MKSYRIFGLHMARELRFLRDSCILCHPPSSIAMKDFLHHFLVGAGAIFLAPAGATPEPSRRITLPPSDATNALAHDFGAIGGDLKRAMDKVEHRYQLELQLNS